MSDSRKLVALILAVMAFGVLVFGIVLGLSKNGPAKGTRLLVAVTPAGDEAAVDQCVRVVKDLLNTDGRVIGGHDGLVVEIATQDPQVITEETRTIEAPGLHPQMRVDRTFSFTRATGFFPRAWPFFAIAGVMLAGSALLLRKR